MSQFDPDNYFADVNAAAQASLNPDAWNSMSHRISVRQQEMAERSERQRTVLEAAADRREHGDGINGLAASYGVGSNQLLEGAGALAGLIPGVGMDNPIRTIGKEGAEYWQERKPVELRYKENRRSDLIAEQDSQWGKFGTALTETLRDPTLLGSLTVESIPSLLTGGAGGRVAGGVARRLGAEAGGQTARRVAVGGAVATNSGFAGGNVASEVYDDLMKLPQELWNNNASYQELVEELGAEGAKDRIARSRAADGALLGAAASALSQGVPYGLVADRLLLGDASRLTGNILARAGKGAMGEAVQELGEEGGGRVAGNVTVARIDPSRLWNEGLGESAGLAMAAGGTVGAITGAASPNQYKQAQQRKTAERNQKITETMESGDPGPLLDPESEFYSPGRAAFALKQYRKNNELTPEQAMAVDTQVAEITAELDQSIARKETLVNNLKPENIKRLVSMRQLNEAALKDLPNNDRETRETLEAQNKMLDERLGPIQREAPRTKQHEHELKNLKAERDILNRMDEESVQEARDPEEIETLVKRARTGQTRQEQEEAGKELVLTMMSDPDSMDPARAQALAEDENSGFSPEQKDYMRSFSESRIAQAAAKTADNVRGDIFTGNKQDGFKGIPDYEKEMARAVRKQNRKAANTALAGIRNFRDHHTQKADAAEQALTQYRETGQEQFLIRNTGEGPVWRVTNKKPSRWGDGRRARNGGLTVHSGTTNLIAGIRQEADVLNLATEQLEQVERLGFTQPAEQSQQAETQTRTQPEAPAAEQTPAAQTPPANNRPAAEQTRPVEAEPETVPEPAETILQEEDTADDPAPAELRERVQNQIALEDLLALPEDAAIAQLNPGNKRIDTGEHIILNKEDVPLPDSAEAIGQIITKDGVELALAEDSDGTLYAVDGDGDVLGYIGKGEDNETVIDVVQEAQKRDIGRQLAKEYIRRNPTDKAGGFTENGEKTYRRALQQLRAEREQKGSLDALQNPTPVSGTLGPAAFFDANLVSSYFTQNLKKMGALTERPLVAVRDFMSRWEAEPGIVDRFLADSQGLTDNQQGLLAHFQAQAKHWAPQIRKNMDRKRDKDNFLHRDYTQFLQEGNPDDNLVNAVAFAAYSWAMENAGGRGMNTDDTIRSILQLSDDAVLSNEQRADFARVGNRDKMIMQEMGKKAAEALGLRARKDAPANVQQQLEGALGGHVAALLMQEGWLERVNVANSKFPKNADMETWGESTGSRVTHPFLRVVRNWDGKDNLPAHAEIQHMQTLTQGNGSVLQKMMGTEPGLVMPETGGAQFEQTLAKRTRQLIPRIQQTVLKAVTKRKHYLREDMHKIRQQFGRSLVAQIQGVTELDNQYTHSTREESVRAKNDAILRDIDRLEDFEAFLADAKHSKRFRFIPSVWRQQRAGLTANMVNPQTSKFQRHNVSMEAWKTTFNPKTDATEIDRFIVAVAQGMGIKTDKLGDEASISALLEMMATEEMVNAIAVLEDAQTRSEEQGLTDQEKATVWEAVKGKEGFHTVDAMVNWARFQTAQLNNTEFTTDIMTEVDGKTNGPALAHILLAAIEPVMGERFGFFIGNDYSSSAEWGQRENNKDLYEFMADKVDSVMKVILDNNPGLSHAANLVQYFNGELVKDGEVTGDGRKQVKQPLTAMVFGSATQSAIASMEDQFIDGIYERLENQANDNDIDGIQESIAHLNRTIREQVGKNAKLFLKMPAGFNETMQLKLNPAQERVIRSAFQATMGKSVEVALEENFRGFMDARRQVNKAAQKSWALYDTAYQTLRAARVKQLIKDGTLASKLERLSGEQGVNALRDLRKETTTTSWNGWLNQKIKSNVISSPLKTNIQALIKGKSESDIEALIRKGDLTVRTTVPLQDLAPNDEAAIRAQLAAVEPIVHTPMSKASGEKNAGLLMSKIKQKLALEQDVAYTGEIQFGEEVPGIGAQGKPGRRVNTSGLKNVEEDPGVAMVIMMVHALDSAIASQAYSKIPSLNIHDALGLGLRDVLRGARELNKATYQLLAGYSIPMEMSASMRRTMEGYTELTKSYPELAQARSELEAQQGDLDAFLAESELEARLAEIKKLSYLKAVDRVDQYAQEGGSYEVTATDRKAVDRMLAKLKSEARPKTRTQAEDAVNPPRETVQREPVEPAPQGRQYPQDTPYGRLGDAKVAPDATLESWFEQNPNSTARQVVPMLRKRLRETAMNAEMREFQEALINQIAKTLPNPDMPIRYITGNTPAPERQRNIKTARGWYEMTGDGESINIKSSEFIHSGLTPELVLHELTHAATAQVIAQEQQRKAKDAQYTSPALDAVTELEQLREAAEQYIDTNNLRDHKEAVKDVHELVAWGMTNPTFQREVLAKVKVTSNAQGNPLVSGMREFIHRMIKTLFSRPGTRGQQLAENGLAVLVANSGALFNQKVGKPVSMVRRQESVDPMTYTSREVFDQLGRDTQGVTDPSHKLQLQGTLDLVVDAVYGPAGALKSVAERMANLTAHDAFVEAVQTGEAPYANAALNHLSLTDQEAFVMESAEVATRHMLNDKNAQAVRRELGRLYQDASKQIQPGDLPPGVHDFLFTRQRNDRGGSDYLSRFMAAALAYKPLRDRLAQLDSRVDTESYQGKTLAQRVSKLFERLMNRLQAKMTNTYIGQRGDDRVTALAKTLASIEGKRKRRMAETQKNNPMYAIERGMENLGDSARAGIEKFGRSKFFKNSSSGFVNFAGSGMSMIAGERFTLFVESMQRAQDRTKEGQQGVFSALLSEMKGADKGTLAFHKLLRVANQHEQRRRAVKEETTQMIQELFGRKLSKNEEDALTRVVLRADLSSLMDDFTTGEMQQLLSDSRALSKAVKDWEAKLSGLKFGTYYQNGAEALGVYLATGERVDVNMMLNAHNIAHMGGTKHLGQVSQRQAQQAQKAIDVLATLHALRHLPKDQKNLALQVITEENYRENDSSLPAEQRGNGFLGTLLMHRHIQQEAKSALFKGNETHFMKGYTKEIFNPYIETRVADEGEGRNLIRAGYTQGEAVKQDPSDPDGHITKHIYTVRDGGMNSLVSGIVSFKGQRARGTNTFQRTQQLLEVDPENMEQVLGQETFARKRAIDQSPERLQALDRMMNQRIHRPVGQAKGDHLVPVLNQQGEIVEYRYLMKEHTKDVVRQRDNRLSQVIGNTVSSNFDKANSPDINRTAIQALRTHYEQDFARRAESYLEFSENSPDREIRDMYRMLPYETKQHIRDVWGEDGMMVRNDLLDMTFGYRKRSVTEAYNLDQLERGVGQQILVGITEKLMGEKAALRVRQAEDFWQAAIRMIKDNWVIKSLFTLVFNTTSNMTQLWWMGVPIKDIVKNHVVAFQNAVAYNKHQREYYRLEQMKASGVLPATQTARDIDQRMIELEEAMQSNPVHELVDEGLFQTIVQDIDTEEDPYSYRAQLARRADEATQWMPQGVKNAGKVMLVTHDTSLYKMLNRATHLSDFMARYTSHQHMTTRKNKPMSREDSIQLAVEAFVNYDIPTHRNIQYLNDMGILWFTKYYMRIQKVLMHLYRTNPGRGIALNMFDGVFPGFGTITGSTLWERDSWLGRGVLDYKDSVEGLVTMRAANQLYPFN